MRIDTFHTIKYNLYDTFDTIRHIRYVSTYSMQKFKTRLELVIRKSCIDLKLTKTGFLDFKSSSYQDIVENIEFTCNYVIY